MVHRKVASSQSGFGSELSTHDRYIQTVSKGGSSPDLRSSMCIVYVVCVVCVSCVWRVCGVCIVCVVYVVT